ncbi:MAG: PPC domain-containing protein [Gemmatimonadaceae bacterium]
MKHLFRGAQGLAVLSAGVFLVACGGGDDPVGPSHVATAMEANSLTTFTGSPGQAVADVPSVVVFDEEGEPLPGAPVVFTVTSGGGSVTGGNVTTNSAGIARLGSVTLDANPGPTTITATLGSLPAVTFTGCAAVAAHPLGSTTDGQLSATDCMFLDGSFIDFYVVNVATAGAYVFSQTSPVLDSYLVLFSANGSLIGYNDDLSASTTNAEIRAVLPAGTFIVGTNSYDPSAIGSYSLASASTTLGNCKDAFTVRGITTAQVLDTSDCANGGVFADFYVIYLISGEPVTISMSSTTVDSYLALYTGGTGSLLASNDNVDTSVKDARLTFSPPVTGFYIVQARSNSTTVTGDYTLGIQ